MSWMKGLKDVVRAAFSWYNPVDLEGVSSISLEKLGVIPVRVLNLDSVTASKFHLSYFRVDSFCHLIGKRTHV